MSDPNKEFDGIRQDDNPLPTWWKWVFFGSIVFAIFYAIYFHKYSNWGTTDYYSAQVQDYEKEFPNRNVKVESVDGVNPFRGKPEAIAAGQTTFQTYCVACHGPTGEGLVGPNLMDKEWLHGNTDKQIYETVMKGIPVEKAKMGRGPMPAHENSLGSEKIYQVMAWLASRNPDLKASN
ncbi:cytochrome C [Leptospira langatensis]|uniref:Cytochrome C n=1 Tax=Leptospira langatensis TaxID=2484983 RepID=A0A5F1ZWX9_9LEPT|nr:cbb3-type cytochrome c oxidase N-terminal domain-containing protein [Leptospira langatensis]TGJ98461.1 cytochrome C [Leptospira langatensis]TGL43375.1 cytochrome C [Leptospira langatensis]